MDKLNSYCPQCNQTTINVFNVDPCDGRGAYEPVRCPNLVIKQDLGCGESLCHRHDREASRARERERERARELERASLADERAFYRDEDPRREPRKPTLEELARYGPPPVHRRLLEVRKELEGEHRAWSVNECTAPVPVEDMLSRVAERDEDLMLEKWIEWPQGKEREEREEEDGGRGGRGGRTRPTGGRL